MAALEGPGRRIDYVTDDDVFDDVNDRCEGESRDKAAPLSGQNRTVFTRDSRNCYSAS